MKYIVTSRHLHEQIGQEPYYTIELQGELPIPVHNVTMQAMNLMRSIKDGEKFVIGAEFEL
jgi:hypothetical protein